MRLRILYAFWQWTLKTKPLGEMMIVPNNMPKICLWTAILVGFVLCTTCMLKKVPPFYQWGIEHYMDRTKTSTRIYHCSWDSSLESRPTSLCCPPRLLTRNRVGAGLILFPPIFLVQRADKLRPHSNEPPVARMGRPYRPEWIAVYSIRLDARAVGRP